MARVSLHGSVGYELLCSNSFLEAALIERTKHLPGCRNFAPEEETTPPDDVPAYLYSVWVPVQDFIDVRLRVARHRTEAKSRVREPVLPIVSNRQRLLTWHIELTRLTPYFSFALVRVLAFASSITRWGLISSCLRDILALAQYGRGAPLPRCRACAKGVALARRVSPLRHRH